MDPFLLFFAILLIPTQFFHNTLTHISIAHKPHLAEFGLIIFELIKIPLALVLVYYEGMGITGAIITISASYVISSIFLTIKNRKKLKGKFKKEFLIKWMKLFWIPTYPKISAIFTRSDVAVFTLMTGSVSAIAYWTSANAVSRIIKHSSKIIELCIQSS